MTQDCSLSHGPRVFVGPRTIPARLIGVAVALVVTVGLFQSVATSFTSSAASQIAKAHAANVILASAQSGKPRRPSNPSSS